MPLTAREIIAALDNWAPPALAYDWDRNGLNVGSASTEVRHVVTALTVTRDVFDAAVAAKAQFIVAHHPLVWEPLKRLDTDNPQTRLCLDIAQAGIAVYSMHTNLDVIPGGVNSMLAGMLGLEGVKPLFPSESAGQVKLVTFVPESHLAAVRDAVSGAGAGVIGDYTHCSFSTPGTGTFLPGDASNPHSGVKGKVNEEAELRFETIVTEARLSHVLRALKSAHPYEEVAYDVVKLANNDSSIGGGARGVLGEEMSLAEFAEMVRAALKVSHVRFVGDAARRVRTVAVLGGGGGGYTGEMPRDIDVYVTGDVKYHDALTAVEHGVAVVDAGHEGTERDIVHVLAAYVRQRFPEVLVTAVHEPEVFQIVTG
jgi:dinuclear metal center YbgI/SA1388 family protein